MTRASALGVAAVLVAAAPAAAQNAFVASSGSGSLSVVDTVTGTAVGAALPITGGDAKRVAISPDGERAYVTSGAGDSVSVVATQPPIAELDTIAVGNDPDEIAITPDGSRAYVANSGATTVSVITLGTDPPSVQTVNIGAVPGGIAISPNGQFALVAHELGSSISVIDTTDNSVDPTPIAVGSNPSGIAFRPDGTKAFVANTGDGTVSVIGFPSRTVSTITGLAPGLRGIAISPDGSVGVVSNQATHTVSVFDAVSDTLQPGTASVTQPQAVAISPDGDFAFAASLSGNALAKVEIDSGTVTSSTPVGTAPFGVAVVPNQVLPAFTFTTAGLAAGFDASGTTATAGVASYRWDYGDGHTSSSGANSAVHLFSAPGGYAVTLTATDANGCSQTTFTGQTATCRVVPARATVSLSLPQGPSGPAGPAGPAGPQGPPGPPGPQGETTTRLAVALASRSYRVRAGRRLRVPFATTLGGRATLVVRKRSGRSAARASRSVGAGAASLALRVRAPGTYRLVLTVRSSDGQSESVRARLSVTRAPRRGGR